MSVTLPLAELMHRYGSPLLTIFATLIFWWANTPPIPSPRFVLLASFTELILRTFSPRVRQIFRPGHLPY
jgi:hypothetical protein